MKGFVKKFISAAMALTVAASMSVYAEETSAAEIVGEESAAVMAGNSVNGGCANHVTFQTSEHLVGQSSYTHWVNGEKCVVQVDTLQYQLICMKCGAVVQTVTRTNETHTGGHA